MYLFIGGARREEERARNIGSEPATQAGAPTGQRASDLSLRGRTPCPLSHTGRGRAESFRFPCSGALPLCACVRACVLTAVGSPCQRRACLARSPCGWVPRTAHVQSTELYQPGLFSLKPYGGKAVLTSKTPSVLSLLVPDVATFTVLYFVMWIRSPVCLWFILPRRPRLACPQGDGHQLVQSLFIQGASIHPSLRKGSCF